MQTHAFKQASYLVYVLRHRRCLQNEILHAMPPIPRGADSEPNPVQAGAVSVLSTVPSGTLMCNMSSSSSLPLSGGAAAPGAGGGAGSGGAPLTVYRVSWSGAGGGRLAQLHLCRQRRFEAPWAEAEAAAALAVGGSTGAAMIHARQVREGGGEERIAP